jgi:transposase
MYARTGRQSMPPEQLLKATVLMALYSIRSERQFCERLRYDLLFKFFLDLSVDDEAIGGFHEVSRPSVSTCRAVGAAVSPP